MTPQIEFWLSAWQCRILRAVWTNEARVTGNQIFCVREGRSHLISIENPQAFQDLGNMNYITRDDNSMLHITDLGISACLSWMNKEEDSQRAKLREKDSNDPFIRYAQLTAKEGDTVESACAWHDEQPDSDKNKIRVGQLLDIIGRLTNELSDTEETLSIIQEGS